MCLERPSRLGNGPATSSFSNEQMQVEIHTEEEYAVAAAHLLAFQNPNSQVRESQSKDRFSMKVKIRKTVTVVRIHDESDQNQTESGTAVKNTKITKSDFNGSRNKESTWTTLTESAANCAKSGKTNDAKSTEAMKKKNKSAVDSLKTQAQKVFTDETELGLLKGIAVFSGENGNGLMSDQDRIFEYVNENLDGRLIRSHLMSNARKLKKKYNKYDVKVRNGEALKPRQEKIYDLSKKIEGRGGNENGKSDVTAKLNWQQKEHTLNVDEGESGDDSLPRLVEIFMRKIGFGHGLNHELAVKGLSLIDKNKRAEMVKQWEILLRDESELNLRRIELVHEQGQLALGALKASFSLH